MENVTVKCVGCKQPWIISAEALEKAKGMIVEEFPEDSLVVIREDAFGYLCAKCQEEGTVQRKIAAKRAKTRASRKVQ
jgi:hypothetical protein